MSAKEAGWAGRMTYVDRKPPLQVAVHCLEQLYNARIETFCYFLAWSNNCQNELIAKIGWEPTARARTPGLTLQNCMFVRHLLRICVWKSHQIAAETDREPKLDLERRARFLPRFFLPRGWKSIQRRKQSLFSHLSLGLQCDECGLTFTLVFLFKSKWWFESFKSESDDTLPELDEHISNKVYVHKFHPLRPQPCISLQPSSYVLSVLDYHSS